MSEQEKPTWEAFVKAIRYRKWMTRVASVICIIFIIRDTYQILNGRIISGVCGLLIVALLIWTLIRWNRESLVEFDFTDKDENE